MYREFPMCLYGADGATKTVGSPDELAEAKTAGWKTHAEQFLDGRESGPPPTVSARPMARRQYPMVLYAATSDEQRVAQNVDEHAALAEQGWLTHAEKFLGAVAAPLTELQPIDTVTDTESDDAGQDGQGDGQSEGEPSADEKAKELHAANVRDVVAAVAEATDSEKLAELLELESTREGGPRKTIVEAIDKRLRQIGEAAQRKA